MMMQRHTLHLCDPRQPPVFLHPRLVNFTEEELFDWKNQQFLCSLMGRDLRIQLLTDLWQDARLNVLKLCCLPWGLPCHFVWFQGRHQWALRPPFLRFLGT